MDAFESELMRRSPLAGCVLELSGHVFDEQMLRRIYERNRGRCYQDTLTFGDFLAMMRDALIRHGGSAHALFVEMEASDANPVNESSFYRKLANTPVAVSRALLLEGSQRLGAVMPASASPLPVCFDRFTVVICDGKKIKDAAKRLAPTRGFSGSLIGAKALVAIDARTGLAIAMSDSLDGMTNDCPLVPELMAQLIEVNADRPILSVVDRQFGEPKTMRAMTTRAGDAFIARVKENHHFTALSCTESSDNKGRRIIDETGFSGGSPRTTAISVRRIRLCRSGEEDVLVVTNLTDIAAYPAADLLDLYARRWGIEEYQPHYPSSARFYHLAA